MLKIKNFSRALTRASETLRPRGPTLRCAARGRPKKVNGPRPRASRGGQCAKIASRFSRKLIWNFLWVLGATLGALGATLGVWVLPCHLLFFLFQFQVLEHWSSFALQMSSSAPNKKFFFSAPMPPKNLSAWISKCAGSCLARAGCCLARAG